MLSLSPAAEKQIAGMTAGGSTWGKEFLRLDASTSGVQLRRDCPHGNDVAIGRNDTAVLIIDAASAPDVDGKLLDFDEDHSTFFVRAPAGASREAS